MVLELEDERPPPPPPPQGCVPGRVEFTGSLYRVSPLPAHALWSEPNFHVEPKGRFNSALRAHGTCYLSSSIPGTYCETVDTPWGPTEHWLRTRGVTRYHVRRRLSLADLAGPGLARLGLDMRILTCRHEDARPWADWLHARAENFDGIQYRARHDGDCVSVALFDRARDALEPVETVAAFECRELIDAIERYGHAIIPDSGRSRG